MKKQDKKNDFIKSFSKSVLVTSLSAVFTSMVLSSAVQASDIEIYQQAQAGDVTLMFLLDVSGSMNAGDSGASGTRIARVRAAMLDLLQGNTVTGVARLEDDKVIGLSTLGYVHPNGGNTAWNNTGAVLVPARKLNAMVGAQTQRQILISTVNGLIAYTGTPTARSYAETVAYLMGRSTNGGGSGFGYSSTTTKNSARTSYVSPDSLTQTEAAKACSGQGVYVLTDGVPNDNGNTLSLARQALGNNGFSCTNSADGWDCTHRLTTQILDPNGNLKNLKFKTAVVGFGNDFNNVTSYDRNKTKAENLAPYLDRWGNKRTDLNDVQNAAYWGIIGEGGWYSGKRSKDVVDSVNAFLGDLTKEIPAVTTGSPSVPKDTLDSSLFSKVAYYPQFQPTPDKNFQLWAGNLKKYKISGEGFLLDKSNQRIVDNTGKLIDGTYDLWAASTITGLEDADVNTVGSKLFAQKGGNWSKLKLRMAGTAENRKVLTNRVASGTNFVNSTSLRQVKVSDLTDATYKLDPNRGYLISLLGYGINPVNPTAATITAAPELRQVGAVMHSSPLLITNKGLIKYDETTKQMTSSNREDYMVFGTTQGVLHVVDADNGEEKFAFVPNEMVENQKEAFLKSDTTTGGLNKMFYGVDGAWTLYNEYVIDGSNNLTVGKGTDSQEGKQFVYGGLRMGGRSYYALNLQDIADPKLQFQISPADQKVYYNGSSKPFAPLQYMGQSWSKPTIAWVKWGTARKRVMIVGGGYDAGGTDGDARTGGVKGAYAGYEDPDYNQNNGIGSGVYMFDADNGDLLWWASSKASTSPATTTSGVIGLNDANLKYSVASEIRTEDRDGDGLTDHLYFGDLGGQFFRIDVNNKATTLGAFSHKVTRLLDLKTEKARFYEMPAFSLYDSAGERFAVLSIGSGNRSLPLKDYATGTVGRVFDAIYNIYDKDVASNTLYSTGHTTKTANITLSGLREISQANRTSTATLVAPYASSDGWYYRFRSGANIQSVKVLSTPIVSNYKMYVSAFDGSKAGLVQGCGAGVKGESALNLFCMPYGQCDLTGGSGGGSGGGTLTEKEKECLVEGGCSIGLGLQNTNIVPIIPDPEPDPVPNSNYCLSTGALGATIASGSVKVGDSKRCLIPQRWYEVFK